ncbi:TrbG/VirB9 family P-type conjugative transfer protein [Caulobacter henricii]|nr:TrbG/VirB9 family P-type conjugative transfer protein [Caulobacter henricii]
MRRLGLGLMVWLALAGGTAQAAVTPRPGPGDPRIRVAPYDPDQVVALTGVLGYQFSIEFADDERIENVSIGDALGWQVTPNAKASLLFLKPLSRTPVTNMTVVTTARRYSFELSVSPSSGAAAARSAMFALRFDYPPPPPEPPPPPVETRPPPRVANAAYSYEGSVGSLPARVFDDGAATYFQFDAGEDYPAIFAIDADGGEAVVNSTERDGYVVVDQVSRGFALRRGTDVTRLYNDAYRDRTAGPLSPKPREKAKPRLRWFQK